MSLAAVPASPDSTTHDDGVIDVMRNRRRLCVGAALGLACLASLAAGYFFQQWLLGGAAASVGLCLLALFVSPRRGSEPARQPPAPQQSPSPPPPEPSSAPAPAAATIENAADRLVEEMIGQDRYALLLRPQIARGLGASHVHRSREALLTWMSVTPEGRVSLRSGHNCLEEEPEEEPEDGQLVSVEAFLVDRYLVTNRRYQGFVDQGGYDQESLWDPAIWPSVVDFVDRTGRPGPRFWSEGRPPAGKEDHPVVGVSWYEAEAYARWAGKRLLIDAEWVKAASWPLERSGGRPVHRKYPWGDGMDPRKANLWAAEIGDTAPVGDFAEGDSPGAVRQLVGNVWEWTASDFDLWDAPSQRLHVEASMKSIRGGAFDTYFDNQAACSFQSGENPVARKHNIGFRCALSACDLAAAEISADLAADGELATVGAGTEEEFGNG